MLRNRRAIALTIGLVLTLLLLASSAFIVHEATHHHDCSGENCFVCRVIAQASEVCRSFGMLVLAALLAAFVMMTRGGASAAAAFAMPASGTLVSRKIRLND